MTVLALDIGGTRLAASAGARTQRTLVRATGQESLDALLALADEVVEGEIEDVGVSFSGPVEDDHVHSHHTPGWDDIGLHELLRERFRAPVVVENDANAGALAEWDAAGRPGEPVAYITIDTGIGAGIVFNGEILEGSHRLAGEIGHFVVEPDGAVCACGKQGCVETLASGPAIAKHGNYSEAAKALNVAIEALVAVVDPLFVAVGGGVSNAPALWEALGKRAVRARSTPLRGAEIIAERAAA
ncbi:MAG: ROK family protein [Actinomycetota bacterium]